jgi:hypothetical protein
MSVFCRLSYIITHFLGLALLKKALLGIKVLIMKKIKNKVSLISLLLLTVLLMTQCAPKRKMGCGGGCNAKTTPNYHRR